VQIGVCRSLMQVKRSLKTKIRRVKKCVIKFYTISLALYTFASKGKSLPKYGPFSHRRSQAGGLPKRCGRGKSENLMGPVGLSKRRDLKQRDRTCLPPPVPPHGANCQQPLSTGLPTGPGIALVPLAP
jgi:hypothetical protein